MVEDLLGVLGIARLLLVLLDRQRVLAGGAPLSRGKAKLGPKKLKQHKKMKPTYRRYGLGPNTAALPSRSERSQHAPHSAERDRAESGLAVVDAIRKHEVVAAHEQT